MLCCIIALRRSNRPRVVQFPISLYHRDKDTSTMTHTLALAASLGLAAVLCGQSAQAQTSVVVGDPDGPNSIPFAAGQYSGEYQLVFDSHVFAAPVSISQIAFASDFTSYPAPGVATYDLVAGMGTTSSSSLNPTPNFSANKRADFTTIFTGTLTTQQTDSQTFDFFLNLASPFVYDPSKGNLLFDVVVKSSSGPSNMGLTDSYTTATNTTYVGRVFHPYSTNANEVASDNEGLWTRFLVTPAPEPSQFAALGIGILGLAALALKARKRIA